MSFEAAFFWLALFILVLFVIIQPNGHEQNEGNGRHYVDVPRGTAYRYQTNVSGPGYFGEGQYRRRKWTRNEQRVVNNFEKTHIITMTEEPNHRIWNAQEWYQYLRSQGLSHRRINSIISVDYGTEILDDFNPIRNNLLVENQPSGYVDTRLYKSQHARMIYTLLAFPILEGIDFKVYRDCQHYVAAVRRVDLRWVPVHFEQRYNLQWYDVRGAFRVR
ncbi:unnamed protein product [Allacma fusca]|uniref:Uncharacterized protein n=1 Tax=Allacma fusca TaxID=39272 RepID=A0A8J2J8I0_9HEXA|nr:unnamed protein product [Allacma fusca]